MMANKKTGGFDFEQALQDLEELVTAMEEGELTLEESLKAFAGEFYTFLKCF
jgi:exonuclease VII small subunit